MTAERPHIAKIIPYLRTGAEIPHVEMLKTLNEATGGMADERRREVASSFFPEAGQYLSSYDLLPFIKADVTDAEARQRIVERKALLVRLSNLLPSVLNLLAIKDEASVYSALSQIDACCGDYHTVKKSEYSSKQHKRIVNEISAALGLTKELELMLQRIERHIGIDFEQHVEACGRVSSIHHPTIKFNDLQRLLGVLRFSSELVLYKDGIGERAFYVGDNRARTHIVEYSYQLAVRFDAPKFATTPGSDFSTLCSLMYEMATGEADESLAGAIIKFGRSNLRRQIDEDEASARYENSDEGMAKWEADNFAAVKNSIEAYEAEAHFWRSMLGSRKWDEFEQVHIGHRLLDVLEPRDDALNKHGPFLVWASQSSTDGLALREIMDDYERLHLKFAETVGRRIRSQRD